MIPENRFDNALAQVPVIAILRGISPNEVLEIANVLVEAGVRAIEIPMNSPRPFESIRILSEHLPPEVLVGCGTATTREHVLQAIDSGAELVVHPHADEELVKVVVNAGKVSVPGVFTPTEAFKMIEAGATALKLFPSELITPQAVSALKAVLPEDSRLVSVGGISTDNMHEYWNAGIRAFGLGSTIYRKGMSPEEVAVAMSFVEKAGRELVKSAVLSGAK
jgi:2-dehydro-3-deoxyphosphogalactonate aldolase